MNSKFNQSTGLSKTLSRVKLNSLHLPNINEPQQQINDDMKDLSKIAQNNSYQADSSFPNLLITIPPGKSNMNPNPSINFIKDSLIHKNMKLTSMIAKVHNFVISVDQLKWILHESLAIIQKYMQETMNHQDIPHKIQIQNIQKEYKKLVDRFDQIQGTAIQELALNNIELEKRNSISFPINNISVSKHLKKNSTMRTFKGSQAFPTSHNTVGFQENQGWHLNQDPSIEFAKIKLNEPVVYLSRQSQPVLTRNEINQQILQSNNQKINQYETKVKQFEAAIEIINEQLKSEKRKKMQDDYANQLKIKHLEQSITSWQQKWINYRSFTQKVIQKLKNRLKTVVENNHYKNADKGTSPNLQHLSDCNYLLVDLCQWESQLLNIDQNLSPQSLTDEKNKKMREYYDLKLNIDSLVRQRQSLQKQNKQNLMNRKAEVKQQTLVNNTFYQEGQVRLLMAQASTIEQLLQSI